jgi:hypothetical protein
MASAPPPHALHAPLRLVTTAHSGRGVVADGAIPAGARLLACEPLVAVSFPEACAWCCARGDGEDGEGGAAGLARCGGCGAVAYCRGSGCQRADWSAAGGHRDECAALRDARGARRAVVPSLRLVAR